MTIKTKADLLKTMSKYGACSLAVEYVRAQPDTATAHEIWTGCADGEWLVWFGVRRRPAAMRAFTYGCADRAVRAYAADALARAGLGGEATKLRALAPIVDADTARAGAAAARAAAPAADAADDDTYDARAAARAAADAADAAYAADAADAADSYAAIRTADAAYYTGVLAYATYAVERRIQLDALHALADAVLVD